MACPASITLAICGVGHPLTVIIIWFNKVVVVVFQTCIKQLLSNPGAELPEGGLLIKSGLCFLSNIMKFMHTVPADE